MENDGQIKDTHTAPIASTIMPYTTVARRPYLSPQRTTLKAPMAQPISYTATWERLALHRLHTPPGYSR